MPVVVAGVHRLPEHESDAYDEAYTLPERLGAVGLRYCISGAVAASNVRNLPYHAAMAASYGLPAEEAESRSHSIRPKSSVWPSGLVRFRLARMPR